MYRRTVFMYYVDWTYP